MPITIRKNSLFAVALLAALSSCQDSGKWMDRLDADPLHARADATRRAAGCANMALELGRSLPVPEHGGTSLAVLYYPSKSEPGRSIVLTPTVKAVFALEGAAGERCAALPKSPSKELGAAAPDGLSMTAYYRDQLAVYQALPATAALYGKGGTPDAEGLKSLKSFAASFQAVAEPGLRGDYYRLNPEFWEWLRSAAGSSLPKA